MSNYPVGQRPRSADLHSKLRLAALAAVMLGVVLLAAAAFVLSYQGIHQIALRAGVSPGLAKLYPLIFDGMLVIAGAAALALRGAGWWARLYAWASLLILLAAVAVGNAVHATNTALPARAARAAVAVTPWVLLLMAFGLLLEMLRHFRKTRAAAKARAEARTAAASGNGSADVNGSAGRPMGVTWAGPANAEGAVPRPGLDALMEPRTGQPPTVEVPYDVGVGDDTGHQADPVSYGEETGYVHPDSYRDEGEYSPHGDSGGPGSYAGPGGYPGQPEQGDYAAGDGYPARHGTAGEAGQAGEAATDAEDGLATKRDAASAETLASPGRPGGAGGAGRAGRPGRAEWHAGNGGWRRAGAGADAEHPDPPRGVRHLRPTSGHATPPRRQSADCRPR